MYYVHQKDADPSSGEPFEDQQSAISAMKADPSVLKVTFVPTEDQLQAWRDREYARIESGEYLPVPWPFGANGLRDHFAHMSRSVPGMIAYTKSPEHGIADRQTRVRPGRYFQEFYADYWNADHIADLVAQCTCLTEGLKIATSPDDIERIYRGGPDSCMSKHPGDYSSPEHPVRVYGNSDLALAYYGTPNRASARAIIWPSKLRHSRVYGGNGVLEKLLKDAGYRPGSLDGARIRAIPVDRGSYVIPYIDYIDFARPSICGQWLILGEGSINAQMTNGLSRDEYDADNEGQDGYCQSCYDDRYTQCVDCENQIRRDSRSHFHVDSVGDLCRSCYQDRHTTCAIDGCDTTWIEAELNRANRATEHTHGLTGICPDCAETHKWCPDCEVYYPISDRPATINPSLIPDRWQTVLDNAAGIVPSRDLTLPDPIYSPHCLTCNRLIPSVDTLPLDVPIVPIPNPAWDVVDGCSCTACQEYEVAKIATAGIVYLRPSNPSVFTDRSL